MILIYATFVLTGIVTTLLGPTLPVLVAWWGLDDAGAGLLFTAQFAGSMLGSTLASLAMPRIGFRPTLISGVVLMAAGVAILGAGGYTIGMIAIFGYGAGLGLAIPATNLYVAEASGAARASALNLLNLAWGAGAVAAPAIVALFQQAGRVRIFLFALAAALIVMAIPLARLPESGVPGARRGEEPIAANGAIRTSRNIAIFGALLFLYVGTENSVAGWVALYAQRLDVVSAALSIAMPGLFWAALLAGRAVAPIILRWIPETRLLIVGLMVALVGLVALPFARSAGVLAASITITGLGLSTIFPLSVAIFTRDLNRAAIRAAGPVFVLASLGGAVLPPLVGIISSQTGSLTAGLLVPLLGCVAMLIMRKKALPNSAVV